MNEIKNYSDVKWYIGSIKRLLVHGNVSKPNVDLYYNIERRKIEDYLSSLGLSITSFNPQNGNNLFENFILAEFSDIKRLANNLSYNHKEAIPQKFKNIFSKFSIKNINNELVENSKIKVCPYCNENFIMNRNEKYVSAELDHFFSKDKYPLFSICLYNLIPVCSTCNRLKSNTELRISPFDRGIDRDSFSITYDITGINYLNDAREIDVNFLSNGPDSIKIIEDMKKLHIDESYKSHSDYVQELIKRKHIYNDARIDEIYNSFKDLFASKEELLRIIFGNYITKENFNKRPLSKLAHDILLQLNVHVK